jgi:fructokinase
VILVAGESLVDLIVDSDDHIRAVPGGGPYNTARTVARLGCACAYVGRLSTDHFGQMLLKHLAADGVDTMSAVATDLPTTLAIAELDDSGSASYRFYVDGTSAPGLSADEVLAALERRPEAVHVGTLGLVLEPMASSLEQLVEAVDGSALVMVDPNCRPLATPDPAAFRSRIDRILGRADVVKVSADDLAFLLPGLAPVEAARQLLQMGPQVVLLTDGGRSVVVLSKATTQSLPVPAVDVVDTVGSGDAFGGGFLAWWSARGLARSELVDHSLVARATSAAIAVASLTCQRRGADPPTLAELGGWERAFGPSEAATVA